MIIICWRQGLIAGEIKSGGGSTHFQTQQQTMQHIVIWKKVEAAVKQINNQERALRHLVSNLNITFTKTLWFPNLTSTQLLQADTNSPLAQISVSMSLLFANTVSQGESDWMIMHWWQGLIVGEIKSVGGKHPLEAAVKQVNNQERVLI